MRPHQYVLLASLLTIAALGRCYGGVARGRAPADGAYSRDSLALLDSVAGLLASILEEYTVPCPLGAATCLLAERPILPASLRVVRSTLAVPPEVLLDSTSTSVRFAQDALHPHDTVWVQFRLLPPEATGEWNAYLLLDSASSAEKPLWKKIQEERQRQQATTSLLRPPFTLKGYAEREATLGETVQSPFAGRMQLELDGELESGLQVHGELSDHSLPFQPDGTSPQLRALERIYLRVSDSLWYAEGGDITLHAANEFLHYDTPMQGLGYGREFGKKPIDSSTRDHFQLALGVAKGEFAEVTLNGQEGIQGPYPLQGGGAGLLHVTALAGSEQVYLDGRLLTRGEGQDYTIDYNLGEVRFTPRHPIHASSRIRVRYEKVARQYTRYLMHGVGRASLRHGWHVQAQGYMGHDAAASLQLDGQKEAAYDALAALSPSESYTHFLPSLEKAEGRTRGGYLPADTVVAGERYTYYRYIPPGQVDSLYHPVFQYAPEGGDYLQTQGGDNEPVYRWIAPRDGKKQGAFTLGRILTPPQSHQLVQTTLGQKRERGETRLTVAYSLFDPNTLRGRNAHVSHDAAHDASHGVATRLYAHYRLFAWKKHTLWGGVDARWVQKAFQPVRDFLPPDYLRHWGLTDTRFTDSWGEAALWVELRNPLGYSKIAQKTLLTGEIKGFAISRDAYYHWRVLDAKVGSSLYFLQKGALRRTTSQINTEIAYRAKLLTPALFFEREAQHSERAIAPTDDYHWWRSGVRLRLGDSLQQRLDVQASYRYDAPVLLPTQLPLRETLEASTHAATMQPGLGSLSLLLNYQRQRAHHSTGRVHTQTFLSQLSADFTLWQRRFAGTLTQELSTENTPEWQQHFIRVPDGQGRYTWIDSNGDGQQQLDEFVLAPFRDQGSYVLQLVPSSKTRATQTANLRWGQRITPRRDARPIDSLTLWWQRFDLETSTQLAQKREQRAWWQTLLPVGDAAHALQHQVQLQATLWFNKAARPLAFFVGGGGTEQGERLTQGENTLRLRTLRGGFSTPDLSRWIVEGEGTLEQRHQHLPYGTSPTLEVATRQLRLTLGVRHTGGAEQRLEGRTTRMHLKQKDVAAKMWEGEYTVRMPLGTKWDGEVKLCYAYADLAPLRGNSLAYTLARGYLDGSNLLGNLTLRWKLTRYVELAARYELRFLGDSPLQQAGNFAVRTVF